MPRQNRYPDNYNLNNYNYDDLTISNAKDYKTSKELIARDWHNKQYYQMLKDL